MTLDPEFIDRLYGRAGAARWRVDRGAFARALENSAGKAFAGLEPDAKTLEHYLAGLHLDDLGLARALEHLGAEWPDQEACIAREHFFSNFLRNKLGARFHHLNALSQGPRLVAACLGDPGPMTSVDPPGHRLS